VIGNDVTLLLLIRHYYVNSEVWYLLFNNEKKLLGTPLAAKAPHIGGLKVAIKEAAFLYLANIQAVDLVVWRCKEPTFLSTQDDDELQKDLLKIDFGNKEQVVKLASGAKVASLGLGEDEVLLVQVPGAISNSSFFPCSQLHPLDLHSEKQHIKGQKTPMNSFIQGENSSVLTA